MTDHEGLTSFSQFGEDLVAHHILGPEAEPARYVDIGSGHPIRFSNTYFFYRRGWRGTLVDPSPEFSVACAAARPEDRFLNAAVGAGTREMTYYRFSPYLYSTCDPARAELLRADSAVSFVEEIRVPRLSLAEILEQSDEHVELLSIDVEGLELSVLESHDWQRVRPTLVVLEILGLVEAGGVFNTNAYRFLRSRDYRLKAVTQSSFFFVDASHPRFRMMASMPFGDVP